MKNLTSWMAITCLSTVLLFVSCKQSTDTKKDADKQTEYSWETAKSGDYEYKYVKDDPSHTRFYTLDNGLSVILSPSKKEPRIQTFIAVKAGSKTDPANHTGLAHYLEHMLFKGTKSFGSLDWEKEKPLLDKIEDLYEEYNSTTDEAKRKEIYQEIDKVSGEAAKFAIANEYDKMMSGMGAKGTNAFTSVEQTVYTEDIPSNAMDKYLAVQAERFKDPVFRIFHTELEAVYEEKNRSLDSDGRKVYEELDRLLFKNHNYGKQTTIGTIEHLKNPSLVEIRKYFDTYYVPNNMGIIMAGDFDPDEVIKKIDDAFGGLEKKDVPEYTFEKEEEITSPIESEVYGPEPERVMLGYRFPGASSEDAKMMDLVSSILTNGSAGLIDLDLVKKQKLLQAYAFSDVMKDYSQLLLGGNPIEGQSLDDVKNLLLGEIEKLKEGDFSDDIITSIINNEKKGMLQSNENYTSRAYRLMNNFVLGTDWLDEVKEVDWLSSVTKQDVVDFANKYLNDNYVVIYKRQGEDKDVVKVEKPAITPVEVNRGAQSDFLKKIADMPENKIDPVWLDYKKDIQNAKSGNYEVLAVKNEDNSLFQLQYYFETGSWANKLLPIAAEYLNYIGTEEKSAEDISKDFYKLASSFRVSVSGRETSISLSGLQENFDETVKMFDDLLENAVADEDALDSYIKRIQKSRKNAKESKAQITRGLQNYALYGKDNPFNYELTDEEVEHLNAQELVDILHQLANVEHKILYYGPNSANAIAKTLKDIHQAPEEFADMGELKEFKAQTTEENKVLMAHYDMVQAEVYWLRNEGEYQEDLQPTISYFNQYFGGGMNSIVFQTIRESKALAYSTYAYYANPSRADEDAFFIAYVGTQADKFTEAVDGMNELLSELPDSPKALENAKKGLRKQLATQRISGMAVIRNYLAAEKMNRDYDVRKTIYDKVNDLTYDDVNAFFEDNIKDKAFTYYIVSGEGKVDQKKLQTIGTVQTLSLEDIFGY